MNETTKILSVLLLFVLHICIASGTKLANLEAEYAQTLLGIDERPKFSWQIQDNETGAYRIIVTDENGEITWDSRKNNSDILLNIRYKGKVLKQSTRYQWIVKI